MLRSTHLFVFVSCLGLSCIGLAAGCSIDVTDQQLATVSERGATAQGVENGTCEDACGGPSADGCWCDEDCVSFGDCCSDYGQLCAIAPGECPFEILCAPDTMPTDTDDDGCLDSCEPVESECFDDSMCDEGERCEAITGGACCPPNALCDMSMPPCSGECVEVENDTCWSDSDCSPGESCVVDEDEAENCCPPGAFCLHIWPACQGTCEETVPAATCAAMLCAPGYDCIDTPAGGQCVPQNECTTDADCENGICDIGATCAGLNCPPPPPNKCLSLPCDDGTQALCEMVPPTCADDEVLAVRNHCFSCLPADSCLEVPPPPPPVQCGPGSDCGDGFHCEYPEGQCGGVGQCVADYDACYEIYAPACGCDGETYGNDCFARAASGGVAHMGECSAPPPPPEGCASDADCGENETCEQVWCITAPCPALCMPVPEPEPASCVDSCGGASSDGSCYCDALCSTWGDCCDDYAEVCSG
jgi:hypothetical protein